MEELEEMPLNGRHNEPLLEMPLYGRDGRYNMPLLFMEEMEEREGWKTYLVPGAILTILHAPLHPVGELSHLLLHDLLGHLDPHALVVGALLYLLLILQVEAIRHIDVGLLLKGTDRLHVDPLEHAVYGALQLGVDFVRVSHNKE